MLMEQTSLKNDNIFAVWYFFKIELFNSTTGNP